MMALWLYVRTLIAYALTALVGIFVFLPCLMLSALMPEAWRLQSKLLFHLLSWSYRLSIRSMLIRTKVYGSTSIPPSPVIFVANHESAIDILLLGSIVGTRPHMWYAYWIFFNTPVLGFFLRRMAIPVYSEHPTRAARAMVRGICLARTYQLDSLLFPEGGRFTDGKVHDFFAGFAMLAKKLNVPVVPIIIRNAGKVYPPHSFLIYPHTVEVEVGDPLVYFSHETQTQFTTRVHQWFIKQS